MTTISRGVKLKLASPIPASPDLEELKKQYIELGIIPYFGNEPREGTLFLQLIKEICGLSPTFNATISAKNKFTFGSRTKVGSTNSFFSLKKGRVIQTICPHPDGNKWNFGQ